MFTLITGASSGIGYELAKICAKNKHNLILVARNKVVLDRFAIELMETFNIKVEVIASDLSDINNCLKVFEKVQDKGLMVDILVNNAGFGDHGLFVKGDWLKFQEMIQLNISTLTYLTYLFLPNMITQKNGKILNVASTASFLPGPLMSVYYATKAYVLSFSEALSEELSDTGVTVTTLCPGPTSSGFQKIAKMDNMPVLNFWKQPSSYDVAEYGYKSMTAGKSVVVHGLINKIIIQIIRLTPRKFVAKMVRRLQEKR